MEKFKWESPAQEKSYLSLVQFWKRNGFFCHTDPTSSDEYMAAFFIQRNIEAHEYWLGMVGDQIKSLQDQIKELQEKVGK